jgi:hypothetical protein
MKRREEVYEAGGRGLDVNFKRLLGNVVGLAHRSSRIRKTFLSSIKTGIRATRSQQIGLLPQVDQRV